MLRVEFPLMFTVGLTLFLLKVDIGKIPTDFKKAVLDWSLQTSKIFCKISVRLNS